MSIHEKPAPAWGVRQTCRESPATAKIHFSPSAAGNRHEYTFTLTDVNVNVEWSGMAWSGIKLILKNWSYLRKFSKSSRLQDDQERSLGLRPLTHSPDIMWECPVQVAWSSSWLIPMLGKAKDQSLMPLKRHIKEPHTSCKYRHVSTRKTEMTQPKLLIFTLHSFTDLNYPHCKNALCNKLHSEGKKNLFFLIVLSLSSRRMTAWTPAPCGSRAWPASKQPAAMEDKTGEAYLQHLLGLPEQEGPWQCLLRRWRQGCPRRTGGLVARGPAAAGSPREREKARISLWNVAVLLLCASSKAMTYIYKLKTTT